MGKTKSLPTYDAKFALVHYPDGRVEVEKIVHQVQAKKEDGRVLVVSKDRSVVERLKERLNTTI